MNRKAYLLLVLCFLMKGGLVYASADHEKAVFQVLERVTGNKDLSGKIVLEKKRSKSNTFFEHHSKDGILYVSGSDNVALCRGFYDYMKQHRYGLKTWSGSSLSVPETFPDEAIRKVVSPFANHYYFNVCTYGYSMPYWDWARWEQEIDWMALHGINMPLALVGYEAIIARVWKKMGLTDEEINQYFVGPAHLPWMRMGNVSGIDGPLNEDWHKQQIALQHQILDRMRALDMKPICPGFPGFIPEAFKRIHPELEIIETHWGGAFRNWMVSPQEPLFKEIGTAFIREWEKEFGKCDYYLVDSFNEMEIPFPEKGNPGRYEMAASYGQKVYESIKAANPKAVWVMQGWMFGYQRYIWDYETLGALVSKVPDQKMLLLDLAVDYNKHFWHSEVNWEYYKGFYNKPWVYSVIPNMGGKVGMTGVLDFYANGHLEALSSVHKGNLVAHGLAPEGIENNEVLYELVTDLSEMTAHYLGGKAEILTKQIDQEYLLGDTLQAQFLQSRFETLLLGIDALLSQHPTLRLDRWLDFASKAAVTSEQKKQYEMNARRIVTIWGPPVDDYAARIWSGLVGRYYLGRWKNYYASRTSGHSFDMAAWERNWVENNQDPDYEKPAIDVVRFAREMLGLSKDISAADLKNDQPNMLGFWNLKEGEEKMFTYQVPARLLKNLKGLQWDLVRGNNDVEILHYELEADGKIISSGDKIEKAGNSQICTFQLPEGIQANNGCVLRVQMKSSNGKIAGTLCVK